MGLWKLKNLSQEERKTLKVAIESFSSGKDAVIPKTIADKLSNPSTYQKSIINSIGKGIEKFFNRKIRNVYKTLKKKFPDRPIRIIVSSAERWRDGLDISNIEQLDMTYYQNSKNVGVKVPLEAFPEDAEVLKKAQEASVFISAGVSINSVFESIRDELKEKSVKMKEHDFSSGGLSGDEFGHTTCRGSAGIMLLK